MKYILKNYIQNTVFFVSIFISLQINCQDSLSFFEKNNNLYQEVAYVHLNKSVYIKGESIGFTAYVFDKKDKKLSSYTKNLYCVISDRNNNVIKEKLVEVKNGIANNIFEIDSSFTSGNYVFKAFTNWMLNFEQQNFYSQELEIIDTEKEQFAKKTKQNKFLDVQVLPESGHFVDNVLSTAGIIIKDSLGAGVPNIKGEIFENGNELLNSFQVNQLGIGKFSIKPQAGKIYTVILDFNGKKITYPIQQKINETGIILKVVKNKESLFLGLETNSLTLVFLKDKKYVITDYDGKTLKKIDVVFIDDLIISKKIPLKDLSAGTHIFTLFDANNKPVAERMFFNFDGLSTLKSDIVNTKKIGLDSVEVKLDYTNYQLSDINNVSISILPINTTSYFKNNNIISQTFLQPYIKSKIENADYYFTNISEQKKYDLDNLLLTQGWSSYNWDDLFDKEIIINNRFESGIDLTVNVQTAKKDYDLLFHHTLKREFNVININNNSSFNALGYLPVDDESLYISKLNKNGTLLPAELYIQSNPLQIPQLIINSNQLIFKPNYYNSENFVNDKIITNSIKKPQLLDEIVIKANKEKERLERIKNSRFGTVYTFDEDTDNRYIDILHFFRTKGLIAERITTSDDIFIARQQLSTTLNGGNSMTIFIDDFQLVNNGQLVWLDMTSIDYININLSGIGEGIQGGGGTIRIYTDPFKRRKRNKKRAFEYKFPLTFSKDKKFYAPIYQSYESAFFQKYGIIDWLPINKINSEGNITIAFPTFQSEKVKLLIEGTTSNGDFILEEKIINVD